MSTQIELKKIRRDGGTQSRADIDKDIVAEYAERMREGVQFPPVTLFYDGKAYWLADGFHRVSAAAAAELTAIAADVRQGTQRDAILHSVGVNANHGLRRTNDDKRRAVEVLLRDPEWRVWSDREIARTAAVDHKTVGKWRAELVQRGEIPQSFAPAAVAKFYSEPIETAAEYAPGISEDADVEAARQVAIQVLELLPREALKQRLENGEDGQSFGGVTYRLGKGEIMDAKGTAHPVGANHIAVALTTNNGAGVYRFDADQLMNWMDERAAFAAQPKVLNALYSLLCGASYMPYGSTEAAKFGLTWGKYASYSGVKLTAFGKATIEAHISSDPKLAEDHRMRLEMNRSGELGYVVQALAEIYKGQKKSGEWVFVDRTWSNDGLLDRAEVLSKNGYLASLKRPALGGGNSQHHFYSITEKGAALLGLPMLPTPPDLPEDAYHSAARTFVAPDAEFTVKVGDSVKKSKNIGRIVSLGKWPEFEVQLPGQYWKQTWYETQVEVVHGESLDGLDPVALAELDLQTAEVWRKAEGLLYALKAWTSDETDNPYGMHSKDGAMEALAQLMRWAADTNSARRLKLELPEELEELVPA